MEERTSKRNIVREGKWWGEQKKNCRNACEVTGKNRQIKKEEKIFLLQISAYFSLLQSCMCVCTLKLTKGKKITYFCHKNNFITHKQNHMKFTAISPPAIFFPSVTDNHILVIY